MSTFLQSYLDEQTAAGFPDFKGAKIEGSVPFTEAMLNAVLAAIPKVNTEKLTIYQLKLLGGSRFSARLRFAIRKKLPLIGEVKAPLQPLVTFRLAPTIYPTVTLAVEEVSGLPGGLLDLIAPLLSDMIPPGVFQIQGHKLTVQLDAALQKLPTTKPIAPLIRDLAIRWHENADGDYYVTLDFQIAP